MQTGAARTVGRAASLGADDDAYLVRERGQDQPRTATWYGTFTGVDNATTTLRPPTRASPRSRCTQAISIWRWTDSTWVDLDTRHGGHHRGQVAGIGPSGALEPFVSGASGLGDVRMRVSCSNTGAPAFALSGDLLKITVAAGGHARKPSPSPPSGTGTGTVTSSPPGINCGADCSESFSQGTVVTLTASPGSSSSVRRLVRSVRRDREPARSR